MDWVMAYFRFAWKAAVAGSLIPWNRGGGWLRMLWLVLVIVVLVLFVFVGARGLGGRARRGEQLSDVAERDMDRQFEKPRDKGDLL
jgi:hypothetical protein